MFPAYAEVAKDGGALGAFLLGDAGVRMAEDHASHAAPYEGAGADEAGLVGDIGCLDGAIAKAQGVLFRVAGVEAALTGMTCIRGAVRHARQGAVVTGGGDATIGPQEHCANLEAAAGAQPTQLQGHVEEDFILESRAFHELDFKASSHAYTALA